MFVASLLMILLAGASALPQNGNSQHPQKVDIDSGGTLDIDAIRRGGHDPNLPAYTPAEAASSVAGQAASSGFGGLGSPPAVGFRVYQSSGGGSSVAVGYSTDFTHHAVGVGAKFNLFKQAGTDSEKLF